MLWNLLFGDQIERKNVTLIKPGETYLGAQGVTYNAGVSRKNAGSQKVCMNVLPMSPGVHSVPHIHEEIETIVFVRGRAHLVSWE